MYDQLAPTPGPRAQTTGDVREDAAQADSGFERLVRLAADICEVPAGVLAFDEGEQVRFECAVGVDARGTCATAELFDGVATDAQALRVASEAAGDPAAQALSGALGIEIRFYVSAPLTTGRDRRRAALIIVDTMPRALGPRCEESLRLVAQEVQSKLDANQRIGELQVERDALLRLVHGESGAAKGGG